MITRLKALAFLLTLCLLAGGAGVPAAFADGVTYVWVGTLADTGAALSGTLAVDAVTIGEKTPASSASADKVWFTSGDSVSIAYTDSAAGGSYVCDVSLDGGVTFAVQGLTSGFTLGDLGLNAALTPYAMVFRIRDAADATRYADSAPCYVYFDNQAPVLLCKAATDNTLVFFAGDDVSGFSADASVNNVSINASSSLTWSGKLTDRGQNVYTYSVRYSGEGTIAAGTLAVRDAAGNIAVWGEDITIAASTASGGTGGTSATGSTRSGTISGGSSGTTTRTVYYSANTDTAVIPYNGVSLVVGTGDMQTLVIGDQTLNLTLRREKAALADSDADGFRASFADWGSAVSTVDSTADEAMDTLVLTPADAEVSEDGEAFLWTFDGTVYKKLAASGIDYMVFTVGDSATALSTAGFTAGLRYNMYRAAGTASKDFEYSIRMDGETVEVQVTVDGNTYTLSSDPNSDFYYYDLYSGTVDMLNQPFGQAGSEQSTVTQGQ